MNKSQKRVFDYLCNHFTVSAFEVAIALNTTVANARHHLNALSRAGLVTKAGERHAGERGRPVQLYRPSRLVLGDGFQNLCAHLLNWLGEIFNKNEIPVMLQNLAVQMVQGYLEQEYTTATGRLSAVLVWLNEHHYQARWEAHAEGAHVILSNCPFEAIIESHPELCILDGYIIEALLGLPILQKRKLEQRAQGTRACLFLAAQEAGD